MESLKENITSILTMYKLGNNKCCKLYDLEINDIIYNNSIMISKCSEYFTSNLFTVKLINNNGEFYALTYHDENGKVSKLYDNYDDLNIEIIKLLEGII